MDKAYNLPKLGALALAIGATCERARQNGLGNAEILAAVSIYAGAMIYASAKSREGAESARVTLATLIHEQLKSLYDVEEAEGPTHG